MELTTLLQGASAFTGAGAGVAFLLGRVLFGLVVAYMGLGHFQALDNYAGYAEAKGVPAPRLSAAFSGGMLAFGGLGIVLGVLPVLASGAVALFMLVSAVMIHDFWAVPDDQKQDQMTQFQKNVIILGAALVFLSLANTTWPYALNISVL
ncbi:DoxX family protein [Halobaculum sp. D14]|uniref:DoxX family protein n=1 Tax=unclassified Halobaculum TaxID=2640896 RepID=UPI003EB9A06D